MATFFLLIIYLAFISLGLPDSLLGSAWTVMRLDYQAPLGWAGIISTAISAGTIFSSLLSEKVIKRFGTGKVTFISVLATALALLGFSLSPSFLWLIVFAIPLGLGAGSVDAGLNNYVAVHYKPHHMSWLHCFWGIGATLGPIIMAQNILHSNYWRGGYFTISMIQFGLVLLLFFTLPLWNRIPGRKSEESVENLEHAGQTGNPEHVEHMESLEYAEQMDNSKHAEHMDNLEHMGQMVSLKHMDQIVSPEHVEHDQDTQISRQVSKGSVFAIKGVKWSLLAFMFYCGVELTVGLWGSSFLVQTKALDPVTSARWISLYYAGITVGRLLTGFLTMRVSCRRLIQSGQIITLIGALLLLLPLASTVSLAGLILIGLGCAPIFPCMLHETPNRFGSDKSQKVMGLQMAFAYIGSTLLPPFLGLVVSMTGISILPIFLVIYIIVMYASSERIEQLLHINKFNIEA